MKDLNDLSGKLALITGSAGLLGVEHAIALINKNAKVILTDISNKRLNSAAEFIYKETGHKPKYYLMDVSSEKSVLEVFKKIKSENLFIDILINNAAIDPKVDSSSVINTSRFEFFSTDDWDMQLNVGLKGAMICSKIFGFEMCQHKKGVILNIASDLSVIAPDQRLYSSEKFSETDQPVKPVTYSVIKHGLVGLTKYTASYWASSGVRCNALSPGGVYNDQNKEFLNRINKLIPMERMARRDEYRGAVQFLCFDASSYMNGQNIVIDGGRSII